MSFRPLNLLVLALPLLALIGCERKITLTETSNSEWISYPSIEGYYQSDMSRAQMSESEIMISKDSSESLSLIHINAQGGLTEAQTENEEWIGQFDVTGKFSYSPVKIKSKLASDGSPLGSKLEMFLSVSKVNKDRISLWQRIPGSRSWRGIFYKKIAAEDVRQLRVQAASGIEQNEAVIAKELSGRRWTLTSYKFRVSGVKRVDCNSKCPTSRNDSYTFADKTAVNVKRVIIHSANFTSSRHVLLNNVFLAEYEVRGGQLHIQIVPSKAGDFALDLSADLRWQSKSWKLHSANSKGEEEDYTFSE